MSKSRYDLFIGCYGSDNKETIHWLEFDETDGRLHKVTSLSGVENPSYLTVNERRGYLYTNSEVEQGEVISYQVDFENKFINELSRQPTKGGPCFVELGDNGEYLLTANYGGGSIIVHKLNHQGIIVKETDFISYCSSNQDRVSKLHTIKNIPGTSYFVATDLGLNKIYFYQFDKEEGTLIQVQDVILPSNSGPRHVAFHPFLNKMYVVTEFNSTILAITYNLPLSNVEVEQELSILPNDFKGENYGAQIQITGNGQYVYVSNRGHHSIATFKVQQNGRLKLISHTHTSGEWPRHFSLSPNNKYMVVANEHSNNLDVMKVQPNGHLKLMQIGNQFLLERPVCVCFSNK